MRPSCARLIGPNRGRRECRVRAAPAVSRAKSKKAHEVVTTGSPEQPGIPRAMVLTVSFVLSPVIGLCCHRRQRNYFRQLDAGVEASGPHDFAVRVQHVSSSMLPRPPHPVPTSVTIAKRPFVWDGMGELLKMLLPTRKAEYFCDQGWTAVSLICPSGNRRR